MTQPSRSRVVVVADTTPLITLGGAGAIDLLHLVFGEIHIPEQVWDEYEKFRTQMMLPDLAQKAAAAVQLPMMGTLGFLLRAKQERQVTAIKPIIDQFARLNRYYSPHLIAQTLQAAGE